MSTRRAFLMQTAATTVVAATASADLLAKGGDEPQSSLTSTKPKGAILKLAIVGTGQISHRYLKQVGARARFVATCARTIESAKARAIEYGIDKWFDNYEAMYDSVAPDAVIVATPTAVHAAPTISALERGIHVLCEKPMAARMEDCHAMVAAAERSGAIFLNMPYDATPAFKTALAYLNEDTLGVFVGAEAQILIPGPSRDNWFYDREIAGGGAGLDTLVYPVSALISMLGPARRVSGFVNTLIPQRILGNGATMDFAPPPRVAADGKVVNSTVDDNATLVIEWSGGQQAIVRALWGTSLVRFNDTAIYGRHGTLWPSSKQVVIHSPEKPVAGAEPVPWKEYDKCYRVPVRLKEGYQWPRDEGLIEHFIDCIHGSSKPTCDGRQQLHVHEILFKGYEAARTGMAQDLKTTFTPWHRIERAFFDTRSRAI